MEPGVGPTNTQKKENLTRVQEIHLKSSHWVLFFFSFRIVFEPTNPTQTVPKDIHL
jgi:hypothetical protein